MKRNLLRGWALAAAAAVLSACAPAMTRPTGTTGANVGAYTPPDIRREAVSAHVRFLAHDLLEGRGTGERGHAIAAAYLATQLQAMGATPMGDKGSYFQDVPLLGAKIASASLSVAKPNGLSRPLVFEQDFWISPAYVRGDFQVEAPLAFVGYGIEAPEYHYDDLHGVDVRGKIAVVMYGAPLGQRADFFPDLPSAVLGDLRQKIVRLQELGAVAVVAVHPPRVEKVVSWDDFIKERRTELLTLRLDAPDAKPGEPHRVLPGVERPRLAMPGKVFDELLAAAGRTERLEGLVAAADSGKPITFDLGLTARIAVRSTVRSFSSQNVVARITKDPSSPLANEAVVVSAHSDHLGIREPVGGDAIYNGAADDAGGCAAVLEIARAFAQGPARPRRSILVAFFTGEERGLLGSEYFAMHPPMPIERMAAIVQTDTDYPISPLRNLEVLGPEHSSIAVNVRDAERALGIKAWPDSQPAQTYFTRSDHYSLVKRGVPAVFPIIGFVGQTPQEAATRREWQKARYHTPADEWEPQRDYQPLADFAKFQYLVALSVADHPERPRWNKGDFFETHPFLK
ncbi:M20/M25/M40 family metallo-hydrolase [Pendulispora brunnea]|uniref:M20/M25/M40 family metallo-hydrolase n=1 Tax=Pendulispora brunnea TaxID=2905690 RepID=A0ABZ2KSL2_9BACT